MADALSTYEITIGVFVFFTGLLFAMRARRPRGSEMQAKSERE